MFHDTDSDEDQSESFKMPKEEDEVVREFEHTMIEKPKERGKSICDMRTLSITRIP